MLLERLPAPEPPVFDGEVLKYSDWKVAFDSLVDELPIKAGHKFFFLKQYLAGKALDAVSSHCMLNTPAAYRDARALLDRRYGDEYSISSAVIDKLERWPKISWRDTEKLRSLSDFLAKCVTLMEDVPSLSSLNNITEILKLVSKLPESMITKWDRKAYGHRERTGKYPPFPKFASFLKKESDIACGSIAARNFRKPLNTEETSTKAKLKVTTNKTTGEVLSEESRCQFCQGDHHISACSEFGKRPLKDRQDYVEKNRLCFGCLCRGHIWKKCRQRLKCDTCELMHPTFLHRQPANRSEKQPRDDEASSISNVITHNLRSKEVVSSMIVPVWLSSDMDPTQEILTYALVDNQSDTTFGLTDVLDCLNTGFSWTTLSLSTMSSTNTRINSKRYRGLRVRGYSSRNYIKIETLYTREFIPVNEHHIPTRESVLEFGHLRQLADKIPSRLDCPVGLLIGYDCPRALLPREIVETEGNDAFGIKTDLGWSIIGKSTDIRVDSGDPIGVTTRLIHGSEVCKEDVSCFRTVRHVKEEIRPHDIIKLLEQDFHDVKSKDVNQAEKLSQEDMEFMRTLAEGIYKDEDGHYTMPLPVRASVQLPENRWVAESRLKSLQKRMQRDPQFATKYNEFMNDMICHGEAEPVDNDDSGQKWYLPHFGVTHPRKPQKVRVVFDCSARCSGICLNDILLQGPDMNNSLLGVLLRFRLEAVALSCDIERMYHQFRVRPEDRDLLRFLWYGENGVIQDYRMNVHVFGAASSPGCAIFGLHQLALDNKERYPEASKFILQNFYVDDGLISVPTSEDSAALVKQSTQLCKQGNIRLCKFVCTSKDVIDTIPVTERAKAVEEQTLPQLIEGVNSALGVVWLNKEDIFSFRVSLKDTDVTKRGILATVSSIYDPLGIAAPFILQGKLILREVSKSGKDWDEELDSEVSMRWRQWREQVTELESLKIDRCYKPKNFGEVVKQELHHFSDAAQDGYGQCTYLRQKSHLGELSCSLVMAKARVSPAKVTTIPRKELQAAVLSTKIAELVKRELQLDDIDEYFYTDSKIVLGYVNNSARRFHVYVANRVQQIQESSEPEQWRHVRSEDNPADVASRGVSVRALIKSRWLTGPEFLHDPSFNPPQETFDVTEGDQEVRISHHTLTEEKRLQEMTRRLSKFSELERAIRAVHAIHQFINRKKDHGPQNYQTALDTIIKTFQGDEFAADIERLSDGVAVRKTSKLHKLNPFLDSNGILRVGGRLNSADVPYSEKHPIILGRKSHLTCLVIRQAHNQVNHQGRGMTISKIRENGYWIIGMSSAVAGYIHQCFMCCKLRANSQTQRMADLPSERLEVAGPFTNVGMDVFGPFKVKEGRRTLKKYGLIFTCLSSRAIHIEMLDDLSSDAFINGYRCLVSLRGKVVTLISDRGTNFIGANRELKEALAEMETSKLKDYLSKNMCEFRFNPPNASHFGGVWERQIRTVRSILTVILSQHQYTLDSSSLRVFFYEVASIINGRPLVYDTLNDPLAQRPLTPNDLLIMKSSRIVQPPGDYNEVTYTRKRWRIVQNMTQRFWKRWRSEYVQSLQPRGTWQEKRKNLKEDDIVLVKDDKCWRGEWPMGRVEKVFRSGDGLVRRALVKMPDASLIERPITKLVMLLRA